MWRATLGTWAVAASAVLGPALPGAAGEIGPGEDLCAEVKRLPEGEELVLRPGEYRGGCAIRRGGSPGAPLVIRAADPTRRPRIVYTGRLTNVLEVRADHVTIRGLAFGPTERDVDGVRIFARSGVVVEDCEFSGLGGIAVVANHHSGSGFAVRRNVIRWSNATGMYFGCHDGSSCILSDLVVERNHIEGISAPDPQIGYGIQFKLNSTGVIRDNVVVDTKGPGIMVYGAEDAARVSVVERNLLVGSRRASGIAVGGGPALVRNNVVMGNAQAGIALVDYRGRSLLREVAVVHNTVYGDQGGGILAPDNGLREVLVVNNAVHARSGSQALPSPQPGLRLAGNVDCSSVPCFVDPAARDFSPLGTSALVGAGAMPGRSWSPVEDFFGARRRGPPTVGAVERAGGPIPLGIKP